MGKIINKIRENWIGRFIIWGALFMVATPPNAAMSNISQWLDLFCGWNERFCNYPDFLRLPTANSIILACLILVAIWQFYPSIYLLIRQNLFRIDWTVENFLNLSSTREMIGTSEDMGIWGESDHRIPSFFLKGRNNRKKPINKISGRIVSTKTNLSIPILLDGMKPEETHGIPGQCDFYVAAIFPDSKPPKQGYTVEDFWRHFGGFDFIFEYDGKTITKHFPEKIVRPYLERKIQESANSLAPKDKPRVKKAQQ